MTTFTTTPPTTTTATGGKENPMPFTLCAEYPYAPEKSGDYLDEEPDADQVALMVWENKVRARRQVHVVPSAILVTALATFLLSRNLLLSAVCVVVGFVTSRWIETNGGWGE